MSEQNETPDVPTDVPEEVVAVEAAEAAPIEQAPPPPPQTPKERKVAARARRGQRRPSTPEERRERKKAKAAARSRWRANRKARRGEERGEPTPRAEPPASNPQTRQGTVISTKADKTITVRIDLARRHKRYQKIVRSSWSLHAHDERNEAGEGDVVRVVETRPMSRTKRWRLTDVVEKAR
jgi:small subunit ribosomal protein S17